MIVHVNAFPIKNKLFYPLKKGFYLVKTKTATIQLWLSLLKSNIDYYKDLERAMLIRYTRCANMLRFTDSTFISPVAWLMVVTRSVLH